MKFLFRVAPLTMVLVTACSKLDGIFGHASSDTCSAASYTVGSSATGTLGVNDCVGPNGFSGQLYSFTATTQANIKLSVATTAFVPTVSVFTAANKIVGEASTDGTLRTFLPAGSYKLLVYNLAGKGGSYTLTSANTSLGGGCISANGTLTDADMGYTLKGVSLSGQITSTDCGALNAKMHWYRVRLASTDTLNTTVTVDKPAGLYFQNTSGAVVASKEFTAAGTWTYTYPATADGSYTLRIESRASGTASNLPLNYTIALK